MEDYTNTIVGVYQGSGVDLNFWLYWLSTFIDIILSLGSAIVLYITGKSFLSTRKLGHGISMPINIYKIMIMAVASLVFLRVSMDSVILLVWQEVSRATMELLQQVNQVFDSLALIPFILCIYLLLRAGPMIEFQLLRQPIPTNLTPTWKMIRGPLLSLGIAVVLSFVVVSTKLM